MCFCNRKIGFYRFVCILNEKTRSFELKVNSVLPFIVKVNKMARERLSQSLLEGLKESGYKLHINYEAAGKFAISFCTTEICYSMDYHCRHFYPIYIESCISVMRVL